MFGMNRMTRVMSLFTALGAMIGGRSGNQSETKTVKKNGFRTPQAAPRSAVSAVRFSKVKDTETVPLGVQRIIMARAEAKRERKRLRNLDQAYATAYGSQSGRWVTARV
jgi:hypothetical protein